MNTSTTTSQRSLNRLIILSFLYSLTCVTFPATALATAQDLLPAVPADLKVTVNGPLTVDRGSQAVIHIHKLINITSSNSSAATATCIITHLMDAGDPCGSVWPVATNCDTDPIYTHYGCHNKYETLYFRVIYTSGSSTAAEGNVTATFVADLSLPVHIIPPSDDQFYLEVVPTTNASMSVVTVHCPQHYIAAADHCWFTLPSHHNILHSGMYDRPIPCGLSPKHPFLYKPTNSIPNTTQTAVTIKSSCTAVGHQYTTVRYTVLFIDSAHRHDPIRLPSSYLIITELAITPLSTDSLSSIDSSFSEYRDNFKLTFPVLPIGGLYPSYSTKQSGYLDTTVFLYSDLQQGRVSFVPNESSDAAYIPTKAQYHYYVSDIDTGQVMGKGVLEVTVSPRLGLRPSVRRNVGFSLLTNETAEINQDHLNFYPPSECLSYVMNITRLPLLGDLYYFNYTRPLEVGSQLNITEGNLSLAYTHKGPRDGSSYDTISTIITCHHSPTQPFDVIIPIRIIQSLTPPDLVYSCSLTLYGYYGHAMPLSVAAGSSTDCPSLMYSGNVLSVSIGSHESLDNLAFVDKNCNISGFHGYPYFNQSVAEECFLDITTQQLNSNEFASLWYLVPQEGSNHSNPNTLLVSYDNGISLLVKYTIFTLLSTPRDDFEQVMDSGKYNHSNSPPTHTHPYLRHNTVLPIHTADSTLITSHFLYVQSLGYLQSGIVFVVVTPPKHGLLCLLQHSCTESVRNFTQEDILSEMLYYRPDTDEQSMVVPEDYMDTFEFEVYYMNDIRVNGINQFNMRLMYLQHKDIEFNQFWVKSGTSKLLRRKHLKHLKHATVSLRHHKFTLIRQPSLGILDTTEFMLQDVIKRRVSYHHNGEEGCSDEILLRVEVKGEIFNASISVAIRTTQSSNIGGSKQHKLDDGDSFTLSVNDLPISTGFCPEFIQVSIKQPLIYGLLIIHDPAHHTKRLLSGNAHFLASDVIQGHVSYQIRPGIAIVEDIQDDLQFGVTDPQGVYKESTVTKRDTDDQSYKDVFHLLILIVPIEGSGLAFDFNLTSTTSKQVVKLGDDSYGAVLDSGDLYLTDTDLLPSEVHFIVHEPPQYGQLQKTHYPVEEFTLADVHSGNISYMLLLPHDVTDVIEDEFRYSISIDLFGSHRRITLDNSFHFNWCYFTVQLSSDSELDTANEDEPTTHFTIRKTGTNHELYDTFVNVVTSSLNNHTIGINCSEPYNNTIMADFCLLNQTLHFQGKSTKQRLPLSILDDDEPEGFEEAINIDLTQPVGCLVTRLTNKRIYISDQEDYSKDVKFNESYVSKEANQCILQETVPEGIGTFNLTLFRHGNLAFRLGVVCYTDGIHTEDYIQRPKADPDSIVYFLPGQSETYCPITIVDDKLNEQKEHFDVKIEIPETEYGHVDHLKESMCVYIDHDVADEPIVFLRQSMITIQERYRYSTTVHFTVARAGADLSRTTTVSFFLISDDNELRTEGLLNTIHVIPSGATELSVSMTILNSTDSNKGPGNFKIQLFDPFNGKLDETNQESSLLEVILLPPQKDIIEFPSTVFVFNETDGFVQVPVYRHGTGNLDYSTIVHCEIQLLTLDIEDVLFLPSEQVTFGPNDTMRTCNFFLRDDAVREDGEYLKINLTTNDPYTQLQTSTAIVKIVDYEDAVYVGLTVPVKYVREPLSNNPIDVTSVQLKVMVRQDTQVNTTICYTTVNGTAKSGINYQHTQGKLLISADVKFVEFTVNIFTEQHSSLDKWFTVSLHSCNHDDNVILLPYNSTRIAIMNLYVGEPFFPTLPIVRTISADAIMNTEGQLVTSYTEPLMCVTSCDSIHPDYHQSSKDCTKQDINPSSTIYRWEWSRGSTDFHPITQDTLFTRADDRILQPPYFSKGVWIRCLSQAVDSTGIRGYTRTSEPVLLNVTSDQCGLQNDTNIEARLTSYDGYHGNTEDLLLLSLTVPHTHNTFPIISTSPPFDHAHSLLTSSLVQGQYPCSTVSHNHEFLPLGDLINDRHELVSKLFFDRYNSTSCTWTFSMWLTVQSLRNHCSARVSLDGLSVNLFLYIQYAQITDNTISPSDHVPLIREPVSFITDTIAPVELPFQYLPFNYTKSHPPKLHLISISYKSNQTQFIVQSLMSVGGSHGDSIFTEGNYVIRNGDHYGKCQLLRNTVLNETTATSLIKQTWLVQISEALPLMTDWSLQLSFTLCSLHHYLDHLEGGPLTCMGQSDTVMYNVPLDSTGDGLSVGMSTVGHARETSLLTGMEGSHMIEISVSLDPSLLPIFPDPRLMLNKVVLCSSANNDITLLKNTEDCINQQDITKLLETKVSKGPTDVLAYVNGSKTKLMDQSHTSTLRWYIHVTVSFEGLNSMISYQWLPLELTTTIVNTKPVDVIPTDLSSSGNEMPVYAIVLISIMLVALVVVMTITGLIICYSLSRKYDLKKLELEAAIQEAKCTVIEKERQRLKEQNRQITSYKKRRDERRYQQRCLLLERNQLPDNNRDSVAPVHERVKEENNEATNKPHPSSPGIQLSELSTLFPANNHAHLVTTKGPPSDTYNNWRVSPRNPPCSYKPVPVKRLPQHTLSALLRGSTPLNTSSLVCTINNVDNNAGGVSNVVTTQPPPPPTSVNNGCWYDRHLARKKAMNTYVELYLGRSKTTDKNEGNHSPPSPGKHNEEESNGATAATKTAVMATNDS